MKNLIGNDEMVSVDDGKPALGGRWMGIDDPLDLKDLFGTTRILIQ